MTININQVTDVFCGSGLARDSGDAVFQDDRSDAIASKPAPTQVEYDHYLYCGHSMTLCIAIVVKLDWVLH